MEQVLLNIVVNARDAMPNGGQLTIRTIDRLISDADAASRAGVQPGRYAELSITDTGCGMTDEVKSHIFEPFFTTKGVGQGTGLGLSTVHGIVMQSGGYIQCDTAPGMGTTFRIGLPALSHPEAGQASDDPGGSLGEGHETILLVEDEHAVRSLVRMALEACGYTVIEARDGQQGLEVALASRDRIDLLLTDVIMPRLDGRELAVRLTREFPRLKVLYMSAYCEEMIERHDLPSDLHFVRKPVSPDDLATKVRELLNSRTQSAW
jgi:CheY-like chemotaxis protein